MASQSTSTPKPFVQSYVPSTPETTPGRFPKSPRGNVFGKRVSIDWHHSPRMLPSDRTSIRERKDESERKAVPLRAFSWAELGSFHDSFDEDDDEDRSRIAQVLNSLKSDKPNPRIVAKHEFEAVTDLTTSIRKKMKSPVGLLPPAHSNATQDFDELHLISPVPTTSTCSSEFSPIKRKNSVDMYSSPVRSNQTVSSVDNFDTPTRPVSALDFNRGPAAKRARTVVGESSRSQEEFGSPRIFPRSFEVKTPRALGNLKRGYLEALGTPVASSTPIVVNRSKRAFNVLEKMKQEASQPPPPKPVVDFSTTESQLDDSFYDPAFDMAFIETMSKVNDETGLTSNTSVPSNLVNSSNTNQLPSPILPSKEVSPPVSSVESNTLPEPTTSNQVDLDDSFYHDFDFIIPDQPSPVVSSQPSPVSSAPTPTPEPLKPKVDVLVQQTPPPFPERRDAPVEPRPPSPKPVEEPYDSFDEDTSFIL